MSYVGNTPTQQAFTPAIDYFSGDGSTVAFTLSRPVASVAQVQVVVNNVQQNPSTAYTVLNNTLTFTGAPSSGTNNIYVEYTSPITQVMQPGQGTVGSTQMASGAALANIGAGGLTQTYLGANVAGNGPVFSAYLGTNQSVSNSTYTKVQFNTEEFDTAGAFNNTGSTVGTAPAYSFNPQVAGYYQIDFKVSVGTSSITSVAANLFKNGANFKSGSGVGSPTFTFASSTGSAVVYLNGSTDYLDVYAYVTATTPIFFGSYVDTYFAGVLVRTA